MGGLGFLFGENLRAWLRARGLVLVLVAALVPAALTAAWVYTHQADIAVTAIEWDVQEPREGDLVNISVTVRNVFDRSVGPFNVSVSVGFYEEDPFRETLQFRTQASESFRVGGLAAGEETQVTLPWTSQGGVFLIEALADSDDELREIEKHNNYRHRQIQVQHPEIRPELPAVDPDDGDEAPAQRQAALRVTALEATPGDAFEGDNITFTARLANDGPDDVEDVTFRLELFRITRGGAVQAVVDERILTLDLPAGTVEEHTIELAEAVRAHYAARAILLPPDGVEGTAPEEEGVIRILSVERRIIFEEPEERLTAKTFYRGLVLDFIHLKILVPIIALFFAANVLEDERRRNTLPYLLTRPVPRWGIPVVRLGVSFIVAGTAVAVGVVATFLLLLGQPGPGTMEFLWWPLGLVLGALFVYGALFTLLGVTTEKPYLWGLLYILGFELLVYVGRYVVQVNGVPLFQSWAEWLSLNHWFLQAFSAWDASVVMEPWLGTHAASAVLAVVGLAVIGLGSLVMAARTMQRRDFDV